MFKNFAPQALGINGRQSELIELALTYGFRGMDVDMVDMFRRSRRTDIDDAAKYLKAAEIKIGAFDLDVNLDADDDAFAVQLATLHPLSEMVQHLGASRASIRIPAATDRLPYHEYFETIRGRLAQIAEVLAAKDVKLGIGFRAGKELTEGKQFPFVRDVEGFIALVKAVAAKNVGYIVDTCDWVIGSGTMAQLTSIKGEEIVAARLGSIASDVEPAEATSGDRVLPEKTGPLDLVAVVKHLSTTGFKGPISPSAAPKRYKGQTRESIVNQAQEAIDGLFRDAGLHVAPRPMDMIEDIPYEPSMRD